MHLTFSLATLVAFVALATAATPRFAIYVDDYHLNVPTDKSFYEGITHVIAAFASPSTFLQNSNTTYKPPLAIDQIRDWVDPTTKFCMAVGGWGDTAGFSEGSATEESRQFFAVQVATYMYNFDYDCVDIDWEYPGGNGDDYKVVPNSAKASEVQNFPLLLQAIRDAIGPDKEMSIAVPGREQDLIAYTTETGPVIDKIVDHVHVMTYDLMNRRDNSTNHHASLVGGNDAVNRYLSRGFSARKLSFGLPFYAKWFTLQNGAACVTPTGCPTQLLEAADGSDTGLSGAITFEASNFPSGIPNNLTITTNGTCGVGTYLKCEPTYCCSQYNSCGTGDEYCGVGCQDGYGKKCSSGSGSGAAPSILQDFATAMDNSQYDTIKGGRYYIDHAENLFWTWDNAEDIQLKYDRIYKNLNLGGVFVWSLGEDSYNWSRLKKIQSLVLADKAKQYQ